MRPRPLDDDQPYELSFHYDGGEEEEGPDVGSRGDVDGYVVQGYDDGFDGRKAARYSKDTKEHGSGCILSAFLYFITITSFVYLSVLWIKQRVHLHSEQMQWW